MTEEIDKDPSLIGDFHIPIISNLLIIKQSELHLGESLGILSNEWELEAFLDEGNHCKLFIERTIGEGEEKEGQGEGKKVIV